MVLAEHDTGRERGAALAAALFISVLVISWVGVAIGANLSRRNLGRANHERADALTIADSGLSLAFYAIHTNETPPAQVSETLGPGTVTAVIEDLGEGQYRVTATGRVGATRRVRHAQIKKFGVAPTFRWAVMGHRKVSGKKAEVDSFNPALGSYASQWMAKYDANTYVMDTKYDKTAKLLDENATIGSNREIVIDKARVGGKLLLPATVNEAKLTIRNPGQGVYEGSGKGPDWNVKTKDAYLTGGFEIQDEPVIFPPIAKRDLIEVQTSNQNSLAYRTDGQTVYHDWNDDKDPGAKRLHVEGRYDVVVLPAGTYYLDELKVKKDGTLRIDGPVKIWVGKKLEIDDGIVNVVSGFSGPRDHRGGPRPHVRTEAEGTGQAHRRLRPRHPRRRALEDGQGERQLQAQGSVHGHDLRPHRQDQGPGGIRHLRLFHGRGGRDHGRRQLPLR